jgi:hypothetical protein
MLTAVMADGTQAAAARNRRRQRYLALCKAGGALWQAAPVPVLCRPTLLDRTMPDAAAGQTGSRGSFGVGVLGKGQSARTRGELLSS